MMNTDRRVCFVVGTRPEAIKLSGIITAMDKSEIPLSVYVTSQHFPHVIEFLPEISMPPCFPTCSDLAEYRSASTLTEKTRILLRQTSKMLARASSQQIVVVQGDTLSAFSGGLAARRCNARLVHVESGLRSGCFNDPFPEEFFRFHLDRMSDLRIAFDEVAVENLVSEGHEIETIKVVDNPLIEEVSLLPTESSRNVVLTTLHRRSVTAEHVRRLARLLHLCSLEHRKHKFILVLHYRFQTLISCSSLAKLNVEVIAPVNRSNFLHLLAESGCVITDSGGVQEEAAYLDIPTLVLRGRSERDHVFGRSGYIKLNDDDLREGCFVDLVSSLLNARYSFAETKRTSRPGSSGSRLADAIMGYINC